MTQQAVTQNVIFDLNYSQLNSIIRSEDKNGRLLGSNGIYSNGYSEINDEIILHRFGYLKGTMNALDLLGKILNNIENCLTFTYYFDNKNKNFKCTGQFDICDNNIIIEHIWCGDCEMNGDMTELYNEIYENIKEIHIEYNKAIKYYKEYYTRLFDRGRTVK